MFDSQEWADSGLLLVDKPTEWTSHDVVNFIRRRFHIPKVGHCGTLDPNATGLLLIVLGKATKLAERFSGQDKTYSGVMRLGVDTHSQDADGEVTATRGTDGLTEEGIRAAAATFVGDQLQTPPMVSAIKMNGQPLYKLARKGKVVEREARPVTIHTFTIQEVAIPDVRFEVACSKGTYVRTLCADLGEKLGCGAHLRELRRLSSGEFSVTDAVTMEFLKSVERPALLERMIPILKLAQAAAAGSARD